MPECIMMVHPKEVFVIHACCNENGEIIKASLFMKHFTQWDQNLDPHIMIEDVEFSYPIPLVTIDNEEFQAEILQARDTIETMLTLLKWGVLSYDLPQV